MSYANIISKYNLGSKVAKVFETIAVAESCINDCCDLGIPELQILNLKGKNKELSEEILNNALSILLSMVDSEYGDAIVSLNGAEITAMVYHKSTKTVSLEEVKFKVGANEVIEESHKEKAEEFEEHSKDELSNQNNEENDLIEEESDSEKNIKNYYSSYYNGLVNELLKRYTSLFSSGYELVRPAGVLSNEGLVKLSGNSMVVGENSIVTYNIYKLIKSYIPFIENPNRSIKDLANDIYNGYNSGGNIIYFPNKMLEFAYGIEPPKSEGANSLKTYNKHSKANSWKGYVSTELEGSIRRLVQKVTYGFVTLEMQNKNIEDYRDSSIGESLKGFLDYARSCLSFCILFPEYKVGKTSNGPEVSAFKIRVCDPTGNLLNINLTPQILQEGFMGSAGKDAFSYQPDINNESYVVEYAHEFNHAMSQATPLFAYKALESILNNGERLSWDRMILGMANDGSILRSIPAEATGKGIKLGLNLTHNISAGSRAGKGVMTLNILASGVASRKNIFYLDRKPDMASLFKYMSPNMFVLNGSDYQQQYDYYNMWSPKDTDNLLGNVPDEVLEAFGVTPTWANLGDLFYMRALKLVIGIIMLRGSFDKPDISLGGEDGILCVVDEFTNFQASYMKLISKLTNFIPNIKLEEAKQKLQEEKMSQASFDRAYNNRNYYALSYMLCAMKDVEYVDNKKRAGFNPLEVGYSDVFVIGQDLQYGEFNYNEFKDSFQLSSSSARKKSVDGVSLNASGFQTGTQSIPYSLVNFKTADAFFGRNDQGYLAAGSSNSKAYGKLDDKASNFAYMNNFTENIREKMVANKGSDNINFANECKYFKPFLILNSSGLNDQCVQGMFTRVETNAGVSREELTQENPSYKDPSRINEAIGFIDYINMAGCDDVSSVLAKSSSIANHVVQNILKYPGDWLQFVTDLSPEWLFTIEDIVLAGTEGDCPLWHPEVNPVLKEYYDFNPERFNGSFEDPSIFSYNAMDDFFYQDNKAEDYSDMDLLEREEHSRLSYVMGDFDNLDEPLDLFDLEEANFNVTDYSSIKEDSQYQDSIREVNELIERLKNIGVSVSVNPESIIQPADVSILGQRHFSDVTFINNSEQTLTSLMNIVTSDIIYKFGGLERMRSFAVKGGSIAVNNQFYTCKISNDCINSVPYDVRREINAGNISSLFYYEYLKSMPNINTLYIDSKEVFVNLVCPALGISSINEIFDVLRNLTSVKIGDKVCTREEYKELEKELEMTRRANSLAASVEKYCFKGTGATWSFTKNMWNKKNCNKLAKALGVTAGVTGTVATGAAGVGVKVGRAVVHTGKSFIKGLKDLF